MFTFDDASVAQLFGRLFAIEQAMDEHDRAAHADSAPDPEYCTECARQLGEASQIEAQLEAYR